MDAPFALSDINQVKAAMHPLRTRIIEILADGPVTASEVGRRLGISASKAHYHVGVLEKHGLVRLAQSRTTNGITEHLYQAVAKHFELRGPRSAGDMVALVEQELTALADDFFAAKRKDPADPSGYLAITRMSGTADNRPTVEAQIEALLKQVDCAFSQPDDRGYRLVLGWAPMSQTPPEEENEC